MIPKAAREILRKTPHDVVVLSAVRSPITRAFKGGFKDSYPEEILMPVRLCRLKFLYSFLIEGGPTKALNTNRL